ncbi:MAG: NAD(P)/FAD-dependent oxidoreductase [Anaerotignum sp.]|nr:NAD(P)/FAD-dependent oxidoreductase [Anaerotignum sp.]MBP3306155.1 NAD(P)/FAD-dependent oxidoreductase [Anaerotignum sp.]MBQ8734299.1 NAD(P)/FAD-dependent oxidoreductase [Anaerotignum sp.]
MKKKVIVVGAGAAGLMAAGRAAEKGHEVHLYEKNNRIGKKILITGKGRCNVTNDSDVEGLLDNIPGNPYFMYSAFYQLDSFGLQEFFRNLGLELKVERGKRVFPVSDRSLDVVLALEKYVKQNKVKLHLESPVDSILIEDGKAAGIRLKNGKEEKADGVIICTGGLSYPGTGSTGDGYRFAKAAGHHVTKLYPSLVPLKTAEDWCHELMGLSLKNIEITVKNNKGKKVYTDFGEMLFTHFGVSGPVILSASRHIILTIEEGYKLYIDLKPAMDEKKLDARILRDFEKFANKDFVNSLDELLPQKLIPVIVQLAEIDPRKKVNSITKEERKRLLGLIKALPLTITGVTGYNEAVVTCGGIETDEIDPSTMESKLVKNLHFAGEVLDVDAYTGGFNLQIAFSTGYTAGEFVCQE